MRIRMTVEDCVAQHIHNSADNSKYVEGGSPARLVYRALSRKIGPDRKVVITTRDELEVIRDELVGEIGACQEMLGQGCGDPSEDRDLRLGIVRMERSADRCERILSGRLEEA